MLAIQDQFGDLGIAAQRAAEERLYPVAPGFLAFDFLRQLIEQATGGAGGAAKCKLVEQREMTFRDVQHPFLHGVVGNQRDAFLPQVESRVERWIRCGAGGHAFQFQPFAGAGQRR